MNIRPLYDRTVVKRIEEQETTHRGIIIPDSAKEKPQEGEVMAIGKGKRLDGKKASALAHCIPSHPSPILPALPPAVRRKATLSDMIRATIALFSTSCPHCRSIELRSVGVRNAIERASTGSCNPTGALSAAATFSYSDGRLPSTERLKQTRRCCHYPGADLLACQDGPCGPPIAMKSHVGRAILPAAGFQPAVPAVRAPESAISGCEQADV